MPVAPQHFRRIRATAPANASATAGVTGTWRRQPSEMAEKAGTAFGFASSQIAAKPAFGANENGRHWSSATNKGVSDHANDEQRQPARAVSEHAQSKEPRREPRYLARSASLSSARRR